LLSLIPSGSTKTALDKNKKSENTPPQTSKQATMGPAKAGLLFFRGEHFNLPGFRGIYSHRIHLRTRMPP
jgi:hypothetical protein